MAFTLCAINFSRPRLTNLYITLTVHRDEISSAGFTISTEGSVQTDRFMQLILKPTRDKKVQR